MCFVSGQELLKSASPEAVALPVYHGRPIENAHSFKGTATAVVYRHPEGIRLQGMKVYSRFFSQVE